MNLRIAASVLSLVAVAIVYIGISSVWRAREEARQRLAVHESHTKMLEEIGSLPADVTNRLYEIKARLAKDSPITDDEIAYCVQTFVKGPLQDNEIAWHSLSIDTSNVIGCSVSFQPNQLATIEQFADQMLAKGEKSNGCVTSALIMLRRCRTPNRKEYFAKYLQSTDPQIQKVAQRMLAAENKVTS